MCGIVGYIGHAECARILLDGLTRLEYRGYDSAGLAVLRDGHLETRRAEGKLARLVEVLESRPLSGTLGIGHTRWATHGGPSERNAHPHRSGPVVVVHNGIVENHRSLAALLKEEGRHFSSETDTEVIAHLIARGVEEGKNLETATREALDRIEGSYAVAVVSESEPDTLIAARRFSPLVIGLGEGETFVASDVPAILAHTRQVIFLEDGDLAVLTREALHISRPDGKSVTRPARRVDWSPAQAEKGGYKHYMLKEIHEQPRALADTLRGRVNLERGQVLLDDLGIEPAQARRFSRIVLVACGTSWHAALVGKFWLEAHTRLPVEVDWASEFRYRTPILDETTLVIALSQSGETADTLAAASDARQAGATVLAICNVMESSLSRASHAVIHTHAGPEISVASTKAFVTQLAALYLFSIWMARCLERIDARSAAHRLLELVRIPVLMEEILHEGDAIRAIAEGIHHVRDFLFIGRWINFPIALEGALKLKEISYIHAEGYPAGEMKHGPIALIDEKVTVVAIATDNPVRDKILSNVQEARARRANLVLIASAGDGEIETGEQPVIRIPRLDAELEPFLTVLPTQLLAYHIADFNGTDVDQPRNLAKSVTVE